MIFFKSPLIANRRVVFYIFFFARWVAEEDVDVNEFSNVEEKANAILRAEVEEVELDGWK